jgi:hypothetical protein
MVNQDPNGALIIQNVRANEANIIGHNGIHRCEIGRESHS